MRVPGSVSESELPRVTPYSTESELLRVTSRSIESEATSVP